jgi:hypothetical protein
MPKRNNRLHIINFTPRNRTEGTPSGSASKFSSETVKWSSTNDKMSKTS